MQYMKDRIRVVSIVYEWWSPKRATKLLLSSLVAFFIIQGSVWAWCATRGTIRSSNRSVFFLPTKLTQDSATDKFVLEVSVIRQSFVIEANATVHAFNSPFLPNGVTTRLDKYARVFPSSLLRLTKQPYSPASARLFRGFGWPWICFRGEASLESTWVSTRGIVLKATESGDAKPTWSEFIPLAMYFPGFVGNWSVIVLVMFLSSILFRTMRKQTSAPLCSGCGYDLTGSSASIACPECNNLIHQVERDQTRKIKSET
jgi:predicted RNA-binding Zn-ribbon protein involved in translation (DUF1610 family)